MKMTATIEGITTFICGKEEMPASYEVVTFGDELTGYVRTDAKFAFKAIMKDKAKLLVQGEIRDVCISKTGTEDFLRVHTC